MTDLVETIVTVTVDGRFAGFDVEDVDRELAEEVARDVVTLVVWLDEEVFAAMRLVDEVFEAVVTVLMQEHALSIFEDEALQPELIAEGGEIAVFVVYLPQNEDATTRSEFKAFRHLSLLQLAETLSARNERLKKRMACIMEP